MSEKIIIFGAGSSYGSDDSNLVPPLGAELFNSLSKYNPNGWGKLPDDCVKVFKEDFEEGMKFTGAKHPMIVSQLQRVMAAFFSNFRPTNKSLYVKLSKKIKDKEWNGLLATLNYDRLLELSLISAGIRPVVGKLATPGSEIEMILPHGCHHLFCEGVTARGNVLISGFNIKTDGKIIAITNPQEFQKRIKDDAFPPVMSYFEPSKKTTSGSSFIEGQRKRFSDSIKKAELIGIVGLKVRDHDTHIWDPLIESSAKIVYLCGETSGEEFKKWALKNNKNNYIVLPYYFKDGFEEFCSLLNM